MVLNHLLLGGVLQVLHAGLCLLEVDVAQAAVEQHLARIELEQQAQLRVVDQRVAAEVEERVVEVGQSLLEVAEQEVGDAFLEVGHGEVLVQLDGALVALDLEGRKSARVRTSCVSGDGAGPSYSLLVLAESRIDDAHVEQDLGRVRDLLERLERLVELIVVVELEGLDPCLYFLYGDMRVSGCSLALAAEVALSRPHGMWRVVGRPHSPVLVTWLLLSRGAAALEEAVRACGLAALGSSWEALRGRQRETRACFLAATSCKIPDGGVCASGGGRARALGGAGWFLTVQHLVWALCSECSAPAADGRSGCCLGRAGASRGWLRGRQQGAGLFESAERRAAARLVVFPRSLVGPNCRRRLLSGSVRDPSAQTKGPKRNDWRWIDGSLVAD